MKCVKMGRGTPGGARERVAAYHETTAVAEAADGGVPWSMLRSRERVSANGVLQNTRVGKRQSSVGL